MVRTKQTQRMSTGGKIPRKDRHGQEYLTEILPRKRELALRKLQEKKNEKARQAEEIAARYTTEARDKRAIRRAEEALKRETEKAAKKTK